MYVFSYIYMYFQVHFAKIMLNSANTITFACLFPKTCRKIQYENADFKCYCRGPKRIRHGIRGQTPVPLLKHKPCRTVFSACSVPIFNALKTTDHTDTHRFSFPPSFVGAPRPFGSSGVAGVTLRLGVQTNDAGQHILWYRLNFCNY